MSMDVIITTETRLSIDLENQIGAIAGLTQIIREQGANIISMALFHSRDHSGELVLPLDTPIRMHGLKQLRENRYRLTHITTWN